MLIHPGESFLALVPYTACDPEFGFAERNQEDDRLELFYLHPACFDPDGFRLTFSSGERKRSNIFSREPAQNINNPSSTSNPAWTHNTVPTVPRPSSKSHGLGATRFRKRKQTWNRSVNTSIPYSPHHVDHPSIVPLAVQWWSVVCVYVSFVERPLLEPPSNRTSKINMRRIVML